MMRFQPSPPGAGLQGRQVYLSLLIVLASHLLLMVTPLHDVVTGTHAPSGAPMDAAWDGLARAHQGAAEPDPAMVAGTAHTAGSDCAKLTAPRAHAGGDCAIQGSAPPRSEPSFLLQSTWAGRLDLVRLTGRMAVSLERLTWPPPPPDLQLLFQVFRI